MLPAAAVNFAMGETRLHSALRNICKDLSEDNTVFALVGGLAVSARTEPRFTKDATDSGSGIQPRKGVAQRVERSPC